MTEATSIQELTEALTPRLVSARHWHDPCFINMPMVYPSGGFVTVRLTHVRHGAKAGLKVSDAGFAYREAESFGAGRAFANTARSVAEIYDVGVGKRTLFVDVSRMMLSGRSST